MLTQQEHRALARPLYHTTEQTEIAKLLARIEALERRRAVSGHYAIKIFDDDEVVTIGDGAFIFGIPYDLNRAKLKYVNAYVTTASSSGLVTVQIRNIGSTQNPINFDMLTTRITIDANEKDAETAATRWAITGAEEENPSYNQYGFPDTDNTVYFRQQLRIDVDTAGTGAKGLGVQLGFD